MTNNRKKNKMPRINFTWFYIIAGASLALIYFFGDENSSFTKESNYSQLSEYIAKGYVNELVVFDNNEVEAYIIPDSALVRPVIKTRIGSVEKFEEFVTSQQAEGHFSGTVLYKEKPQYWSGILINILPLIFFIGIWIFLMRRMSGGGGAGGGG